MDVSYLHGLLPRLGFFIGEESRIPYDFDGILACIAPRPTLIIAPTWDQYTNIKDIRLCIDEVQKVYDLFKAKDNLEILTPEDYNRFTPETQQNVIKWLTKH